MQIGVDSFVAAIVNAAGRAVDPARHLSELLEAIVLADEVGLDVFAVGEHHRREFLDSAPALILAAAAARTQRIRLTSAVTVLSAAEPVRVFVEFATLDLLSQGRAEMVVGRGSFTEAFPLFGLQLKDYDSLFAENLLSDGCRRIVSNKTSSRHRTSRHQGGPNAPGRSMRSEQPKQHMSRTYKAVQATQPGKLEIVEREIIEPAFGQVRIRVQACGVFH